MQVIYFYFKFKIFRQAFFFPIFLLKHIIFSIFNFGFLAQGRWIISLCLWAYRVIILAICCVFSIRRCLSFASLFLSKCLFLAFLLFIILSQGAWRVFEFIDLFIWGFRWISEGDVLMIGFKLTLFPVFKFSSGVFPAPFAISH